MPRHERACAEDHRDAAALGPEPGGDAGRDEGGDAEDRAELQPGGSRMGPAREMGGGPRGAPQVHGLAVERPGREPLRGRLQCLTCHDACYLGRYNGIFDEPRDVLYRIPGVRVVEMEKCRDRGFCCGAGGGRMWMEERIGEKVNHRRLSHIEETNANAVATACPYCLIMLDDAAKTKNREDIRRYDIAELLERSL